MQVGLNLWRMAGGIVLVHFIYMAQRDKAVRRARSMGLREPLLVATDEEVQSDSVEATTV